MKKRKTPKKRIKTYLKTKEEKDAWREKNFKHIGRNKQYAVKTDPIEILFEPENEK